MPASLTSTKSGAFPNTITGFIRTQLYKEFPVAANLIGRQLNLRTLAIWLNGYVNGQRGKTLIDPDTVRESVLIAYCVDHSKTLALDAARSVVGR
jgi:hypothetical protein